MAVVGPFLKYPCGWHSSFHLLRIIVRNYENYRKEYNKYKYNGNNCSETNLIIQQMPILFAKLKTFQVFFIERWLRQRFFFVLFTNMYVAHKLVDLSATFLFVLRIKTQCLPNICRFLKDEWIWWEQWTNNDDNRATHFGSSNFVNASSQIGREYRITVCFFFFSCFEGKFDIFFKLS